MNNIGTYSGNDPGIDLGGQIKSSVLNSVSCGIAILKPVIDKYDLIKDFVYEFINKPALKNLNKTIHPGASLIETFPGTLSDGIFDIYVSVYLSGKTYNHVFHYSHEGIDCWYSQDIAKDENVLVITTNDISQAKEQELFVKKIADITPGIISVFNVNSGEYRFINKGIEKIVGYTSEEMLTKGFDFFTTLIHPGDLHKFFEMNKELIAEANSNPAFDKIINTEYRVLAKNGEYRWFCTYGTVFHRNLNGNVEHIINMSVDITERKLIEDTILRNEELLTEAQNIAQVGSWEWNLDNNEIKWSRELYNIYGYNFKEQLITFDFFINHIHPDDRNRIENEISAALRDQRNFTFEHRIIQKNGQVRILSCKGRLLTNESGDLVKVIGSAQDISERKGAEDIINLKNRQLTNAYLELKKAQKELILSNVDLEEKIKGRTLELEESVNKFESLIQAIPLIAWTYLPNGETTFFNKAGKEFLGISTVAEWDFKRFIYAIDQQAALERWNETLSTGNPFECEYRWIRHDGEVRWMLGRSNPIYNAYGEIILWIGSATEIHAQKTVQEKKDEFIGIASHELKTPLTSAKAYLQLLERIYVENPNAKASAYVTKANVFIDKLQLLISDLLDVSKIQAGKLQYNMHEFDFDQFMEESLETMQHTSGKHKIIMEGCAKVKYKGDKQRIEQVFSNYLTNAIKYSPNADKILVNVQNTGNEIRVAVKDYGIGIPKEKVSKVFDRFYRVEGLPHTYSGLGIGLFIAAEVVKRHNGKTWVESEEGSGSIFYFSLPLKQD